jgi:pimeloyl-ACP methyl ester carboxylesterase
LLVRDVHGLRLGCQVHGALVSADQLAFEALAAGDLGGRPDGDAAPDEALEVSGLAKRALDTRRRDVDGVFPPIVVELAGNALAESVVHPFGMVDVDAEALGTEQLNGEHLGARDPLLDSPGELLLELPLLCVDVLHRSSYRHKKWAPRAHFAKPVKCGKWQDSKAVSVVPTQTREGTIELPDGRTLAYADRGPEDGTPIVFHHGTPGSRVGHHPDPSTYERAGVRTVTFDRAGYGRSDRLAGRDVAIVAEDVAAVADELGFNRFAVMGVSGGGPHALACGALLAHRVTRAVVMVTPAPYGDDDFDFLEGMTKSNVSEFSAALAGPDEIAKYLAPYVEMLKTNPEAVLDEISAELPPPDQAMQARPEVRQMLVANWQEATRQGAAGWMDDDLAFTRPWGFDLADVAVEVRMWHGELDVLSPRSHGERVAERLPNASFDLVAGKGHLLYDAWADALAWAAA